MPSSGRASWRKVSTKKPRSSPWTAVAIRMGPDSLVGTVCITRSAHHSGAGTGARASCANLPVLMRICLVYDCLFPHTVGGAERWYRNLGERLAADAHDVTYLTLRQWD